MKKTLLAALILASTAAMAAPVSWIDWASPTTGSLTIGSSTVGVTLTGTPLSMVYDDYYFSPFAATYGGLNPHDLIQVNNPTTFTLTFSQAIVNPYVALVSVGQPGYGVSYTFNGPINSMGAAGPNYWGTGSGSYSGNTFTGVEYNGVLQLSGSFSALTVSTAPNESWHGFNIGSEALAGSVPEPGSLALIGLGLAGLAAASRRKSV